MVKINRGYLDPALSSLNDHTNSMLDKSRAEREALRAAAQAIADKAKSDLIFRTNISRGIMIALMLVGLGILLALASNPVSKALSGSDTRGFAAILDTEPTPNSPSNPNAISKSVTLFNSRQYNAENAPFSDIVAGHRFNSVFDEIWSEAYCYTNIHNGVDKINVDLSNYDSPSSQIQLNTYMPNQRFTRDEFIRAQQVCPYQTVDF